MAALFHDRGMIERFNFLSRDADIKELEGQIAQEREILSGQESKRQDIEEEITAIDERMLAIENELSGTSIGFLDSIRSGISDASKSLASYKNQISSYVESLGKTPSLFVNLMALYVLKTMIIPLTLLYVLSVFLRMVWKVDLRSKFSSSPPTVPARA